MRWFMEVKFGKRDFSISFYFRSKQHYIHCIQIQTGCGGGGSDGSGSGGNDNGDIHKPSRALEK